MCSAAWKSEAGTRPPIARDSVAEVARSEPGNAQYDLLVMAGIQRST